MSIKDKSQLKAIIKRAITDVELMLPELRKTTERKFESSKGSKKSQFKMHLAFFELLTKNSLIIQHRNKHKLFNRETRVFFYFDLETAVIERKSGARYPTEIAIATAVLDSNLKFLDREIVEHDFVNISAHCIERVIERSGETTFLAAISLFSPICLHLFALSAILRSKVEYNKRYILYWSSGYIVLKKSETESNPVVITWLPKKWFSQSQTNKFANLNEDKRVYLIEESIFNGTSILKIQDTVNFKQNSTPL